MTRTELLNYSLSLIEPLSVSDATKCHRFWISPDESAAWGVKNIRDYYLSLEEVVLTDVFVAKNFSRERVRKHLESELLKARKSDSTISPEHSKSIFEVFSKSVPKTVYVAAPISGVRIDLEKDSFKLSIFEFGKLENMEPPVANSGGLYIKVPVKDSYDELIAIEKASNFMSDFSRMIIFISGKVDGSIVIKTGLPVFHSISHEMMYVDTSSYQIGSEAERFGSFNVSNRFIEKVPIDSPLFEANEDFPALWGLFEKKMMGGQLTDIQKRIVNSALAVGEAAKMENVRNSIIYTCIALEILFSFDEGSIFQKSIADRLGDTFAFLIAKEKESRIATAKLLKKVYRMRSGLVHGGEKEINGDYVAILVYLRVAISELLKNKKFEKVAGVEDLYNMVKEAQYSYSG